MSRTILPKATTLPIRNKQPAGRSELTAHVNEGEGRIGSEARCTP